MPCNIKQGNFFKPRNYVTGLFFYAAAHEGGAGREAYHNENDRMFPSSLLDRSSANSVSPANPSDHTDCIVPLLHFPLHDGIVFEWDMVDNFKAGDFTDDHVYNPQATNDEAYLSMQPLRYVDIMGRADLFSFRLFSKTDWEFGDAQKLPQAVVTVTNAEALVAVQGGDEMGIALDKDGREEISFDYQINLLHQASEDDDDFITFPNLFGQKEGALKMCLSSEPKSLFDENMNISSAEIIADNVSYSLLDDSLNSIEIRITQPAGVDLGRVNSIVLYEENEAGGRYAYIVKNVSKLPNADKLRSWWLHPVFNT